MTDTVTPRAAGAAAVTQGFFAGRPQRNPFFHDVPTLVRRVSTPYISVVVEVSVREDTALKVGYITDEMGVTRRTRAVKVRSEGKARAESIVALAQAGISRQIGSTDITDLTEEQLKDMCRRLMRG